jgi:hypothetical protein
MRNMQQRYYKGRTIQQTPVANFQNHIMRQPQQTRSACSIVSSNISISGKKTFPTMIANIAARGHEQHEAFE